MTARFVLRCLVLLAVAMWVVPLCAHVVDGGAQRDTANLSRAAAGIPALPEEFSGHLCTDLEHGPSRQDCQVSSTVSRTLTAWGKQLNADSASDPRIQRFLERYVQGKQTPEPGAACTGGRAV